MTTPARTTARVCVCGGVNAVESVSVLSGCLGTKLSGWIELVATDRLLIVDWPVWVLPGLGSLQRAGGEVPRPQRQFSATHTRAPRRGGKRWRGGGWCKGTQDTAERGGAKSWDTSESLKMCCALLLFFTWSLISGFTGAAQTFAHWRRRYSAGFEVHRLASSMFTPLQNLSSFICLTITNLLCTRSIHSFAPALPPSLSSLLSRSPPFTALFSSNSARGHKSPFCCFSGLASSLLSSPLLLLLSAHSRCPSSANICYL